MNTRVATRILLQAPRMQLTAKLVRSARRERLLRRDTVCPALLQTQGREAGERNRRAQTSVQLRLTACPTMRVVAELRMQGCYKARSSRPRLWMRTRTQIVLRQVSRARQRAATSTSRLRATWKTWSATRSSPRRQRVRSKAQAPTFRVLKTRA